MLSQAFAVECSSVTVYRNRRSTERMVAVDFALDDLWFVLLNFGLWDVECLELVNFWIFDDLEPIKIEN